MPVLACTHSANRELTFWVINLQNNENNKLADFIESVSNREVLTIFVTHVDNTPLTHLRTVLGQLNDEEFKELLQITGLFIDEVHSLLSMGDTPATGNTPKDQAKYEKLLRLIVNGNVKAAPLSSTATAARKTVESPFRKVVMISSTPGDIIGFLEFNNLWNSRSLYIVREHTQTLVERGFIGAFLAHPFPHLTGITFVDMGDAFNVEHGYGRGGKPVEPVREDAPWASYPWSTAPEQMKDAIIDIFSRETNSVVLEFTTPLVNVGIHTLEHHAQVLVWWYHDETLGGLGRTLTERGVEKHAIPPLILTVSSGLCFFYVWENGSVVKKGITLDWRNQAYSSVDDAVHDLLIKPGARFHGTKLVYIITNVGKEGKEYNRLFAPSEGSQLHFVTDIMVKVAIKDGHVSSDLLAAMQASARGNRYGAQAGEGVKVYTPAGVDRLILNQYHSQSQWSLPDEPREIPFDPSSDADMSSIYTTGGRDAILSVSMGYARFGKSGNKLQAKAGAMVKGEVQKMGGLMSFLQEHYPNTSPPSLQPADTDVNEDVDAGADASACADDRALYLLAIGSVGCSVEDLKKACAVSSVESIRCPQGLHIVLDGVAIKLHGSASITLTEHLTEHLPTVMQRLPSWFTRIIDAPLSELTEQELPEFVESMLDHFPAVKSQVSDSDALTYVQMHLQQQQAQPQPVVGGDNGQVADEAMDGMDGIDGMDTMDGMDGIDGMDTMDDAEPVADSVVGGTIDADSQEAAALYLLVCGSVQPTKADFRKACPKHAKQQSQVSRLPDATIQQRLSDILPLLPVWHARIVGLNPLLSKDSIKAVNAAPPTPPYDMYAVTTDAEYATALARFVDNMLARFPSVNNELAPGQREDLKMYSARHLQWFCAPFTPTGDGFGGNEAMTATAFLRAGLRALTRYRESIGDREFTNTQLEYLLKYTFREQHANVAGRSASTGRVFWGQHADNHAPANGTGVLIQVSGVKPKKYAMNWDVLQQPPQQSLLQGPQQVAQQSQLNQVLPPHPTDAADAAAADAADAAAADAADAAAAAEDAEDADASAAIASKRTYIQSLLPDGYDLSGLQITRKRRSNGRPDWFFRYPGSRQFNSVKTLVQHLEQQPQT